ncbi:hypothetical protein [Thermobifida fusca]|jgi:hypothetical protein|uniref:hypothetical protein n=1 Tax=Thermobifida fusca TaxID=2021 RepID=UPI00077C745A|nr:hypothetical protein [Thermobifida fusca]
MTNSSATQPQPDRSPPRTTLLTELADEVRALGGTALVALSATAHPVLYVRRTGGRLIPVVVVEDAAANRWFIWGRTGSEHVSRPKQAAAALCGLDRLPPRSWVNPVAARRAAAKGAA